MLRLAGGAALATLCASTGALTLLGNTNPTGGKPMPDRQDSQSLRPPLPRAMLPLPPGSVTAKGWLYQQLRRQADGLTGGVGAVFPDLGPDSAWRGGDGEAWERGPYYLRGLVALAWALDDAKLKAAAQEWIDWTLESQRQDGSFGPTPLNPVDWWPRMPMLHALTMYHEATGDARVIPFLTKYFAFQHAHLADKPLFQWATARAADNVMSVLYVYEHINTQTSDPEAVWLLDLAHMLLSQSIDWVPVYRAHSFGADYWTVHGVNVAEGLRDPAMRYRLYHDTDYLDGLAAELDYLRTAHWQIEGLHSNDEYLVGRAPTRGAETCTVVEMILSCQTLLETSGDPIYADMLERLGFNALPALFDPDLKAHQYYQTPNQVQCVVGEYEWTTTHDAMDENTFGVGVGYGCCISNLHMGWPRFANGLWMRTPGDGLVAVAYAPCELHTEINGQQVRIHEVTDYPFDDSVALLIDIDADATFALMLHVPAWCSAPHITVNGEAVQAAPGSFAIIARTWADGDIVELRFPMTVQLSHWERDAVGVERGPLVYALKIKERWTKRAEYGAGFSKWELRPGSAWNYALVLNPNNPEAAFTYEQEASLPDQPWDSKEKSVRLLAEARLLPGWGMQGNVTGAMPQSPVEEGGPPVPVTLIPYGAAKLRLAVWPWRRT